MSQNKTVIPESEYDLHHPISSDMNSSSEFYRPSGVAANSTVISGTGFAASPPLSSSVKQNQISEAADPNKRYIPIQERVIIGVLFSISKGLLGEIFPIYLGRNLIGTSTSADICLKEQTVSEEHAILHVRCDNYPGDCYLSITDYGSSHGTTVNHKDCRYETLPVRDGDILVIGRHYQLCVCLFDIEKSGLFEDNEFEEPDTASVSISTQYHSSGDFYSPSQSINNDNKTVIG